ncbi:MAG: bile acid:sodium symporter, partial [Isosphaeraceae bacterium]
LGFLLASYAVAAVAPGFGLAIRDVSFGNATMAGESMKVSLPAVMLAILLLNAGLGVKASELGRLARGPGMLVAGLGANLVLPIVFIFAVARLMGFWHNPDEVQNILVGLALVASMPIAGSSTAWSQNADGNLALSLGLVLLSTLLSPLTTPLGLHSVGLMATGDYAEDLHELAAHGTGLFLAVCVIAPSLVGIVVRRLVGEARIESARPWLKLGNAVNLLLLSYSNAAAALPQAVSDPDWDFLAVILLITASLSLLTFSSGWGIARALGADDGQKASLMYGLGMNNNGTGLVLASMTLADHPRVMIPIIFYNLVQQVAAGGVGTFLSRWRRPDTEPLDAEVEPVKVISHPSGRLRLRRWRTG